MPLHADPAQLARDIAVVRRFNRFYTQKIGVLGEGWQHSAFTLTEARVLYEVGYRADPSATELARELGLDAGYLSRILAKFEKKKLLKRTPSPTDGRRYHLALTDKGRETLTPLEDVTRADVAIMLEPISAADRARMVQAMAAIEAAMGDAAPASGYSLRDPRPGDFSFILNRQMRVYGDEYGWNAEFETTAGEILVEFAKNFDPKRERCWIAERGGEVIGSVFLVKQSDTVAKLRMLYVDASARGLGLGRRLVEECIAQARAWGYKTLTLWTYETLTTARRIYASQGFKRVKVDPHHSFGQDLVGEHWDLDLDADQAAGSGKSRRST